MVSRYYDNDSDSYDSIMDEEYSDEGPGAMEDSFEGIKVGNMMIYPTNTGGMRVEWDNDEYHVDR